MRVDRIARATRITASGVMLVAVTTGVTAQDARSTWVPTFTTDVAPILYKNCVSCHRPGEMGPMSLVTYSEARPWARAIRERVIARSLC